MVDVRYLDGHSISNVELAPDCPRCHGTGRIGRVVRSRLPSLTAQERLPGASTIAHHAKMRGDSEISAGGRRRRKPPPGVSQLSLATVSSGDTCL
jgi:hypothetical protein